MRTSRRGFLRLVGGAAALGLGAGNARARETALDIHRATRNTLLGAVGALWPWPSDPPPPKAYPGARRMALPVAGGLRGVSLVEACRRYAPATRFETAPLPLDRLTRLLYLTNGVTARRGSLALRAAPSAGALYSGEVYVIAENVSGLDPGAYHYDVLDHALVALREGSLLDEVGQAVEREHAIGKASAIVLLTNVFARYTHRYANRGYRYALIDSGHIGENLRLTAVSAGLSDVSPLRFHDDRLNALLGIDGREEAVCALHAVGRPSEDGTAGAAGVRQLAESQPDPDGSAIERYHEATKLVPRDAANATRPVEAQPPAPPGERVALASGKSSPMSVEQAIRQRRSATRFRPEPLAPEALAFVLESAHGSPRLRRAPGVGLWLAAHRVSGLVPGLYRYEPEASSLVLLRSGDLRAPMTRACLGQQKAGAAAVGFLMVADLAAAARWGGERSYRDLLLEAGAIGQRIYLAAEAAGLAARNLAAFLDDDLNELVGLDGRGQGVVHVTMLAPGD